MNIPLSGEELINIAIDIERRGIAFYDVMSRSTEDAAARDVFQRLAEMERVHIQIFQGMLGETDKYQPSGERADYLQALVDNAVFSDDAITSEMATQANSDIKAIELAIAAEKDSILFYYEMKETVPQHPHQMLNRIIAEEKSHMEQLSALKKKLGTK